MTRAPISTFSVCAHTLRTYFTNAKRETLFFRVERELCISSRYHVIESEMLIGCLDLFGQW